jgi:hypothetical protein
MTKNTVIIIQSVVIILLLALFYLWSAVAQ